MKEITLAILIAVFVTLVFVDYTRKKSDKTN